MEKTSRIHELPALHGRARVFRDRVAAGLVLAGMVESYRETSALVLAIPAGGVPVAREISAALGLTLDVAPVSKVLLPWTTEAGYGAVAFDGTIWIDDAAVERFGLTPQQVTQGVARAREKVERRMARLRAGRALPSFAGRPVLVVDDGIAAGSTIRAAIAALRSQGAGELVVVVPTAHENALCAIAGLADIVYCANIRAGFSFAVADAYEKWHDVSDAEVAAILDNGKTPRV